MEKKLGYVGLYGIIAIMLAGFGSWVLFGKVKPFLQIIVFLLTTAYVLFVRKERP
jgi:hypothetical protein